MRKNIKKCFTINPTRKKEDFIEYDSLLKENLFQALEIFYPYQLTLDEQKEYTNNVSMLLKKYPNIEVVMHLPYGKDNDLCDFLGYEAIVSRLKDAIKYTSQFQTKKLTLHLGAVKKDVERRIYVEHIIKVLVNLCDFAQKYQMNVMIENMPRDNELGFSPEEILEIIIKTSKDNLKFILDTGHAHVSGYGSIKYIEVLKDYLYHIHFSDNDQSTDQHRRIGLGNINFYEIFSSLEEIKYDELHCLEIIFNNANDLRLYVSDLENVANFK